MVPPRLGGASAGVLLDVWLRTATRAAKQSASKFIRVSQDSTQHSLHVNPHTGSIARRAAESIFGGVFRAVRTAPQTPYAKASRLQPRTASPSQLLRSARPQVGRRAFGPSPRPIAYPTHTSQVGLGAARNFSSTRPIFQNIIENVPLGLRALGDADGIDERKWRKERKTLRRAGRTAVKGQGRQVLHPEMLRKQEFASFFGSNVAEVGFQAASVEEVEAPLVGRDAIVLVLPLDPLLPLLPIASSALSLSSSSYRILTPTTLHSLHSIQSAYESHAHRVRTLSNRLTRAGVFDDPTVGVELVFVDGEKVVEVTFPAGKWSRRDVEQACGEWRGGEQWYEIHGGDAEVGVEVERTETLLGSTLDGSSASSSSAGEEDDFAVHDDVAATFILPNISHVISPEATHWSEDWDAHDVTWGAPPTTEDDSDASSCLVWDEEVDEEASRAYVGGVQTFLEDLEMVEREREFRPAMVGGLRL